MLATVQAIGMTAGLSSQGLFFSSGFVTSFVAIVSLITGSMFMMWLGEQITEKGIGNGISMLIFAGIVAGLPAAIGQSIEQARQGELSILMLLFILAAGLAVIWIIVMIEKGQRRITLIMLKGNKAEEWFRHRKAIFHLRLIWRVLSLLFLPHQFFCSQRLLQNGLAGPRKR